MKMQRCEGRILIMTLSRKIRACCVICIENKPVIRPPFIEFKRAARSAQIASKSPKKPSEACTGPKGNPGGPLGAVAGGTLGPVVSGTKMSGCDLRNVPPAVVAKVKAQLASLGLKDLNKSSIVKERLKW